MPSREQIERLLAQEPDDVFLNFGLAMELAKTDAAAALQRFDRVVSLDPDYTAAYYQKGRLLLGLSRSEEARAVLSAGVQAAVRSGDDHAEHEMRELLASAG